MLDSIVEGLKDWARLVTIVIFMGLALELVVPEGNTRKYVRLVTGLLVLLAILRPVASLAGSEGALPLDTRLIGATGPPGRTDDVYDLGRRVNSAGVDAALRECKDRVERVMENEIAALPGVRSCAVDLTLLPGADGGAPRVEAVVRVIMVNAPEEREAREAEIRELLTRRHGMNSNSIRLTITDR